MSFETSASRRYAALALAHRWFAFLETQWGNLEAHLDMFDPNVTLTGHHGAATFANDHESLRRWFRSIPGPTSSHHILHAVWTDDPSTSGGALSFVVAYQSAPTEGRPGGGSIISYQTLVRFTGSTARFLQLDKTPILPNVDPSYAPSWASNRILALVYTALAAPGTSADLDVIFGIGTELTATAWSDVSTNADEYEGTVAAHAPTGRTEVARLIVQDGPDATLPRLLAATTDTVLS